MNPRLLHGDCIEVMRELDECSVDAVVTDPPYGLEFMGKEWDSLGAMQEWHHAWATEALRVLKPGGYLLAFGGTRTYHRLACAVEDAGFEIRDRIVYFNSEGEIIAIENPLGTELVWLYGSGFPKSLDVSKAIDRQLGSPRAVAGRGVDVDRGALDVGGSTGKAKNGLKAEWIETEPQTPDAERWQGWGTALKPAHEPIVVARKPLAGTVAANVLEHGTGAINVDGCRIGFQSEEDQASAFPGGKVTSHGAGSLAGPGAAQEVDRGEFAAERNDVGRWPANVVLDEEAAELLDEQAPNTGGGGFCGGGISDGLIYGDPGSGQTRMTGRVDANGGASRFFYCAKTSRAERNAGLDGFATTKRSDEGYGSIQQPKLDRAAPRENWQPHVTANHHPTVKPISLMRWLVRLVTPPGGLILDPFLGSGTTGIAAALEGFEFVGIEREADYLKIAEARIAHWSAQPQQLALEAPA